MDSILICFNYSVMCLKFSFNSLTCLQLLQKNDWTVFKITDSFSSWKTKTKLIFIFAHTY